jgi:hypothetical protein
MRRDSEREARRFDTSLYRYTTGMTRHLGLRAV